MFTILLNELVQLIQKNQNIRGSACKPPMFMLYYNHYVQVRFISFYTNIPFNNRCTSGSQYRCCPPVLNTLPHLMVNKRQIQKTGFVFE